MLLNGKIAVVTGGTRGIGKAIAAAFAKEGASIALFGIQPQRGNQVAEELAPLMGSGQNVRFYQVDVANAQKVEHAMHQVLEDFKTIDILVNNAGVTRDSLLMKMREEDWEEVLNTNLKSVYYTCRAVVRPMLKARQGGKIINISSVVGLTGNAGQANYAASKSGMIGFTKSLAKELASRNICINCIAPGFVETDMTNCLTDAQKKLLIDQIPMRRIGAPEDVAHAALFLASPLSDYVTGQVLTVDGGMVM